MASTPEDTPGRTDGEEATDRVVHKPRRIPKTDDEQPKEPVTEEEQESSSEKDQPLGLHERIAAKSAFENMSGGVGFAGPSDIEGHVAGRDQIITYHAYHGAEQARAEVVTGVVTRKDLDDITATYVEPSIYRLAREILERRRVLVLYGRAHWGKRVTALRLLDDLKAKEIHRLSPDEDVRRLGTNGAKQGHSYIADTLAPAQARQLNGFELDVLSDVLCEHHGHLAITVDSGTIRRHELEHECVVSCEQPPDAADVLYAHLSRRLEKNRADELIADPQVQEFLQQTLLQPHDVVALADDLVKVSKDGSDLDAALARFDEKVIKDIEAWFHDHIDRGDRAFMVAMAVFNGAPYQEVLDAAAKLEELFSQVEDPENPGGKPLFSTTKNEQLEKSCAQSVWTDEVRSLGAMRVEAVEFTDSRYAPIVLDTVWQHPAARRPLLIWLQELAAHPSTRIRVHAAMAIGRLTTYGFGYIYDEILGEWSREPNYRLRQSVAWILAIPALDPTLAPIVRALLREWSHRDSSRWRKLTAATAYGTEVGMLFPDTALRGLKRIATENDDDVQIGLVVSYSITNLFEAGYQDDVLDALLAWTEVEQDSRQHSKQKVLARNALACFLRIADEAIIEPSPIEEGWPHLLAVTHNDTHKTEQLITLWRRALGTKALVRDAQDVLHDWVTKADHDQRLQETLWQFVNALAKTDHDTQRLTYNLRRWAEDPEEPSRVATYLLTKLEQRGS